MPLTYKEHSEVDAQYLHKITRWVWANAAARTAQSVAAADIHKVGYQEDNATLWILIDDSPATWSPLGNTTGPTGAAGGSLAGTYPNPTIAAGVISATEIHDDLKPSETASPSDEALRALGTSADEACAGNDSRLTNSRAPSGSAGGDLGGTYPNPSVEKVDGVTPGAFGLTMLATANAGAGRTALELGTSATLDAGVANGVATLDSSGLVPTGQLPSYVDDVLEFADFASFPGTGTTGKIYIAIDTGFQYRWSGSVYVQLISGGTPTGSAGGSLAGTYPNPTIAAGAISATEINNSLKPSGSAATTDEALRALGTGANDACAGNDSRLSDARTPTDASVTHAKLSTAAKTFTINYEINGGGAAITAGIKGDLIIDFDWTIKQVTLLADQSTSAVLDLWVDTYANYPPTNADAITASAKPTLTAALKSQDATLTGWSVDVDAGEVLRVNVDSNNNAQRILLSIKAERR